MVKPKGLSESNSKAPEPNTNESNIFANQNNSTASLNSKVELSNGFRIQDYLIDSTWKRLLQSEFQKSYFLEINEFLEKEYQKGIVRPPKELIFNAFNSTKIDEVCLKI